MDMYDIGFTELPLDSDLGEEALFLLKEWGVKGVRTINPRDIIQVSAATTKITGTWRNFSHWLDPKDLDIMDTQLVTANAYKDTDEDGTVLNWNYTG